MILFDKHTSLRGVVGLGAALYGLTGAAVMAQPAAAPPAAAPPAAPAAPAATAQQPVGADEFLSRLRLKAGESYRAMVSSDQTISMSLQGQPTNVMRLIDIGYRLDVQSVAENGDATVKVTYESIAFQERSPGGVMEYSSSQTEPVNPILRFVAAIAGQSVTATISPLGRVVKLEGVQEMVQALQDEQAKSEMPEQVQAILARVIDQAFGEPAVQETIHGMTGSHPPTAVKVGGEWQDKRVNQFGDARFNDEGTYRLVSRERGRAVVEGKGNSVQDPQTEGITLGPGGSSRDLKGSFTAKMEVDEATGWPVKSEGVVSLSGTVLPQPGTAFTPSPISMRIRNRITIAPMAATGAATGAR